MDRGPSQANQPPTLVYLTDARLASPLLLPGTSRPPPPFYLPDRCESSGGGCQQQWMDRGPCQADQPTLAGEGQAGQVLGKGGQHFITVVFLQHESEIYIIEVKRRELSKIT